MRALRLRLSIAPAVLAALALLALSATAQAQPGQAPQTIAPLHPPFEMPELERPAFPDRRFDIRDHGAEPITGDSEPLVTDAIHRAITAAHDAGGGQVLIPEGTWLSGSIHLQSNVELHLAEGAELRFSTDRDDYLPVVPQRHEGVEAYNYAPMIYASRVENVAITGQGTLNAQGEHWWQWFERHGAPPRALATQVPLSRRDFGKGADQEGMRPAFIVFWHAENILVEGVSLQDSPMWNIHLTYSENAIVRNVRIDSRRTPNGDGVVVDSSRNVLVEYNRFRTGDDAVVLKSGLNEEGRAIGIPTENVVVRHFQAEDVGTGSGGIVFGSETSGGIRNVYVHDADFDGTDRGIRFKTERGRGSVIEQIHIRDVTMNNIGYEAINFNSFYTGPDRTGPAPTARDIHIRDVSIDGVPTAISLTGLPEKWLENVTLENIEISNAEMGARFTRVKNLKLKNLSIASQSLAMLANDVFELTLEDVSLEDEVSGGPLRLEGRYTGAVFLGDGLNEEQVQLGSGVSSEVLNPELPEQRW